MKSIKGLVLFCQDSSFVRRERLFELDDSKKTALFQHELCHYLLTIVQCKRIIKTITEGGEVNTSSVQEIINSFRKENKQLNLDYDNDTKHGADIDQQKKWYEWIDKELISLKSYKIKGE